MAKAIEVPKFVKKAEAYVDLMEHGSGTPWEDRGGMGVISAFFKTVYRSIVAPSTLWNHIRRPETEQDAKAFAIGCGIFWSLGVLIDDWLIFYHNSNLVPLKYDVDPMYFWIVTGLKVLLCPLLVFLFVRISSTLYHRMVSHTMKYKAPPALTFNLFAYSLGPSLFAIIPFVGAYIAAVWILFNMARSGVIRQRITLGSSFTSAIISGGACAIVIFGGMYLARYFFIDDYLVYPLHPVPVIKVRNQ